LSRRKRSDKLAESIGSWDSKDESEGLSKGKMKMFKFDLDAMVSEVEGFVTERGKRIPTDEAVILLSKEGYLLAVDNEGDLDVEKGVVILKSVISLTTKLNCSPGRNGGIGLTAWEKVSGNKTVSELTQLRRDLESNGLDATIARNVLGKYMTDLLSSKTGVLAPKEIIAKYV